MTKKELREIYKKKRAELTGSQREKLQDILLIRFQQLDIRIPEKIMSYAAFKDEFDPQLILDYCSFKNPEQTIIYPLISQPDNRIRSMAVSAETTFRVNSYGIAEPMNGYEIAPAEIDMVIVPLLAFDRAGYRVGYGKGYYDRFLSECREDTLKIGFSFFEAAGNILDVHEYDIKLDYCISPEKLYNFNL